MSALSSKRLGRFDRLGTGLSLACAVHCMFQSALLSVLPLLGLGFMMDERLENAFVAASVLLASATLAAGYRQHRSTQVFVPLSIGIVLLAASRLFEHGATEHVFAVLGAISIASSHLGNLYFSHQHQEQAGTCLHHQHEHHTSTPTTVGTQPLNVFSTEQGIFS